MLIGVMQSYRIGAMSVSAPKKTRPSIRFSRRVDGRLAGERAAACLLLGWWLSCKNRRSTNNQTFQMYCQINAHGKQASSAKRFSLVHACLELG